MPMSSAVAVQPIVRSTRPLASGPSSLRSADRSITKTRMNGSSSALMTCAPNMTWMSGRPGIITNRAANPMKKASSP